MRPIETTVSVGNDGTATLRVPADVLPGEHRAILLLDENRAGSPPSSATRISAGDAATRPVVPAALQQRLLEAGLLAEIKPPPPPLPARTPIAVRGQPLSESIIAERR
jgi:hypothetical protein